jgi:hypothetical protein
MVQDSRPLVETARVPGIVESEQFEVQVMAELVAERAQKMFRTRWPASGPPFGATRGSASFPDHCLRKLRAPAAFADPERSCREHPNWRAWKWVHQYPYFVGSEKRPVSRPELPGIGAEIKPELFRNRRRHRGHSREVVELEYNYGLHKEERCEDFN